MPALSRLKIVCIRRPSSVSLDGSHIVPPQMPYAFSMSVTARTKIAGLFCAPMLATFHIMLPRCVEKVVSSCVNPGLYRMAWKPCEKSQMLMYSARAHGSAGVARHEPCSDSGSWFSTSSHDGRCTWTVSMTLFKRRPSISALHPPPLRLTNRSLDTNRDEVDGTIKPRACSLSMYSSATTRMALL